METNFPNDNNIKINIISELEEKITLALRIPSYAENYIVLVNDKKYDKDLFGGTTVISVKGRYITNGNWKTNEL